MGVFWGYLVVVKTSFASQGEAGTGLGSFKYTLSQLLSHSCEVHVLCHCVLIEVLWEYLVVGKEPALKTSISPQAKEGNQCGSLRKTLTACKLKLGFCVDGCFLIPRGQERAGRKNVYCSANPSRNWACSISTAVLFWWFANSNNVFS